MGQEEGGCEIQEQYRREVKVHCFRYNQWIMTNCLFRIRITEFCCL